MEKLDCHAFLSEYLDYAPQIVEIERQPVPCYGSRPCHLGAQIPADPQPVVRNFSCVSPVSPLGFVSIPSCGERRDASRLRRRFL